MKKQLTFLLLAIVFALQGLFGYGQTAVPITIGTGTTTTNICPIPGNSGYHNSVMLFTPDEINCQGAINRLAFQISVAHATNSRSMKIYLKETTDQTLPASIVFNDYLEGATLVYQETNVDIAATGWKMFNFSQSFSYSGVNSLLVIVIGEGCTASGGCAISQYYTSAANKAWTLNQNTNINYDTPQSTNYRNNRFNIRFFITPTSSFCSYPSGITVPFATLTPTSAKISWTAAGSESKWIVQYKPASITDWNAVGVMTDTAYSTLHTLSALLTPNTLYNIRVRSICNPLVFNPVVGEDISLWSTVVDFRTGCMPITTFPWRENFNDTEWAVATAPGNEAAPHCWLVFNGGSENYKWLRSSENHSGSGADMGAASLSYSSYTATAVHSDWLVLPSMNLTGNERVSFWAKKRSGNYQAVLSVYVYDVGTNGSISSITDTSLFVQRGATLSISSADWTYFEVPLTGLIGEHRIAFVRNRVVDGLWTDLDDITVDTMPVCHEVFNLAGTAVSQSAVALQWYTPINDNIGWTVAYGDAQTFDLAIPTSYNTAIVAGGTTLPVSISGLIAGKVYKFAVRQSCNSGQWSNIIICAVPAELPYFCDFENSAINSGWTLNNGTQTNRWINGTAVSNGYGGNASLYISNNNYDNAYTISSSSNSATSYVYAYRSVNIQDTLHQLEFSFDWRSVGEDFRDVARAFLVPVSADISAGVDNGLSGGNDGVPTGWIDIGNGNLNRQNTWQKKAYLFNVYSKGVYNIVFFWKNDNADGTQPPIAIDNVLLRVNSCSGVAQITTVSVTDSSANITWTAGGSDTVWRVKCIPFNADHRLYPADTVNNTSFVVNHISGIATSLSPNMQYDLWIQTFCSATDSGAWTKHTFRTQWQCPIVVSSFPWSESFEDDWTATGFETAPRCWLNVNGGTVNSNYKWTRSTADKHSGSASAAMFGGSTLNNTIIHSDWLITPKIALTGQEILSYWTKNGSTSYIDDISVYLLDVTNRGDITAVSDTNKFTLLIPSEVQTTAWKNHALSLHAYVGEYRLAFVRNKLKGGGYLYLDDVKIDRQTSTCLDIPHFVASGISATKAECSWWMYDRDSTDWVVAYGKANTFNLSDPDTYDSVSIAYGTILPYVITGLDPATAYKITIRDTCSNRWGETVTFATFNEATPLPYSTNFADSIDNQGWTLLNGAQSNNLQTNKWYIGKGLDLLNSGGYAVPPGSSDSSSLYISNRGAINQYINATSYVYAYRDFHVPDNVTELKLSFDWRSQGNSPKNQFARIYWTELGAATSFNAGAAPSGIYDQRAQIGAYGDGGEHWLSNASSWHHEEMRISTDQFPNLAGRTWRLYIHWRNETTSSVQPPAAIDNLSLHATACNMPTQLRATNMMANAADITWTGVAPSATITMQYMPSYSSDWSTASEITGIPPALPYNLIGLSNFAAYKIRIKAVCGINDESNWSPAITIRTLCSPISALPWFEDFDYHGTGSGIFPSCWTKKSTLSDYPYLYATNAYNNSIASLYFNSGSTAGAYSMAVTPPFAASLPINTLRAKFWHRMSNSGNIFVVGVMTHPDSVNSFVPVDTVRSTLANIWMQHETKFNNYSGTGHYIAFKVPYTTSYYIYLDNLIIDTIPSCPDVCDFSALTSGNNVTLSWRNTPAIAASSGWIIAWDTVPIAQFNPNTAAYTTIADATDMSHQISGLASGTAYIFAMKSDCGGAWSTPIAVGTHPTETFGNGIWHGYIYKSVTPDVWQNRFGSYLGFVTEPAQFERPAGGANTTPWTGENPVWLNGITIPSDYFAARYKMSYNFPCGYYTITLPSVNRAARLSIDGGQTWLNNLCQGTYCGSAATWEINNGYPTGNYKATVYLSGVTQIVFEFFAQEANHKAGFRFAPLPLAITLSGFTPTSFDVTADITSGDLWNIVVTKSPQTDMSNITDTAYSVTSTASNPHRVSGLNPDSVYYVYAQTDCGGAWGVLPVTMPNSCPQPTNVSFDIATQTLSWDAIGQTGWNIKISNSLLTDPDTAAANVLNTGYSSTPQMQFVLPQGGKPYYFYVRSACGSQWGTYKLDYCTPTTTGTSYWLTSAETTGGLINFTNTATAGAYHNFTNIVCSNTAGDSLKITLTGNGTNPYFAFAGYVDWNRNYNFDDPGERVFNTMTNAYANSYVGTINIPTGTPAGTYRLRVATCFYGTISSCSMTLYGSFHDYMLRVFCDMPTDLTVNAITDSSVQIRWNAGQANQWEIFCKIADSSAWSAAIPVATNTYTLSELAPGRMYDVRVRAICGIGDTSISCVPITFTTLQKPCLKVKELRATTITHNAITITWTTGAAETNWEITGKIAGSSEQATPVNVTDRVYTFSDLISDSTYHICVKAVCSETLRSADTCIDVTTATDGIPAFSWERSVTLYPNPATDKLTVYMTAKFQTIEISNLLGQTLYSAKIDGAHMDLDISDYAPGIYFVKLHGETGTITKKFAKK